MNITIKLTVAILAMCLVPLLAITLVAYHDARDSLSDESLDHLESVAEVQVHRAEDVVDQNLQRLALLTSRTQLLIDIDSYVQVPDLAIQQRMNGNLQDALSSIISFEEISVLNLEGETIASTDGALLGTVHIEEEYFNRGLDEASADILFLDQAGDLDIHLSAPLHLGERLIGVVAAKADADAIVSLVADYTGLGKTGETLLAQRDENGDAIFITPLRFDPEAVLKRIVSQDDLELPITQALLKNEGLFTDSIDYRGESVLAATQYIEKSDWGLVAKIDKSEAFEPIEDLRNFMLIVAAISSVLIIVFAYIVARTISGPIVSLTHTATAISRGDLSKRSDLKSKDEIGMLAQSFNTMTENLLESNSGLEQKVQDRTKELEIEIVERKRVEETMRLHSEIITNMLEAVCLVRSEDGIVVYTNPAFENMFGYSHDEMLGMHVSIVNAPTSKSPDETAVEIMSSIAATGFWDGEVCNTKKDGTYFWCHEKGSVFDHPEFGNVILGVHTDITERKRAEELLRESETQFRHYFELANIGFALTSPEKGWLKANERICQILGYSWEELSSTNWAELTHPDDLQADEDQFSLVLAGKIDNYELNKRFIRGDGSIVFTHLTVSCLRNDDRTVKYIIATLEDITERKQASDVFLAQKHRNELILETTMDGFILADINGKLIEVNPAYSELIGYSGEELVAMNIRELEGQLSTEAIEQRIELMVKLGSAQFETKHKHKNGQMIDLEVSIAIMQPETEPLVIAFVRDITERKQVEEALLNSETDLRNAQQLAQIGNWNLDVSTGIAKLSEEMARIWGYDSSVDHLSYETIMSLIHPDDVDRVNRSMQQAMDQGIIYTEEFRIALPTGEERYIHGVGEAEKDAAENIICIKGTGQDITERKLAEERLKETLKDLHRSNQELERFAYVVSHDLQEPLRMVASYVQLLEKRYKDQLDQDANDFINFAADGAIRMQHMISDILEYSRVGTRAGLLKKSISILSSFKC